MNRKNLQDLLLLTSRDNTSTILSQEMNLHGLKYIDPYYREGKSMVFDADTAMSARLMLSCGLVLPLYKERPIFSNNAVSHWVTKLSSWNLVRRDCFADFVQNGALPVYLDESSGLIGMLGDEAIEKREAVFFSFLVERLRWLFTSTWRYGNRVSKDWEKSCNLIANSILNLVRSYGGVDIPGRRLTACGHINIHCYDTVSSFNRTPVFSRTVTLPAALGDGVMIDISSKCIVISYAGTRLRKWWSFSGNNYNFERKENVGDWSDYSILDHVTGGQSYTRQYGVDKSSLNYDHGYIRDPVVIADPSHPTAEELSGNRCFPRRLLGWSIPPSASVKALGLGMVTSCDLEYCRIFCQGAANQAIIDMDALVRQYYSEKGEKLPESFKSLGWSAVASRRRHDMSASLEATTAYQVCKRLDQKDQFLNMEYAEGKKFKQMNQRHREYLNEGLRQVTCMSVSSYITPLEGVVYPYTLSGAKDRETGVITFYFDRGDGVECKDDLDKLREWIEAYNDGMICTYSVYKIHSDPQTALETLANLVGMKVAADSSQEKPELCKELMEFYDAMDRWHSLFYFDTMGVGLDLHLSFTSNEAKLVTSASLGIALELLIESVLRWGLFDESQRTAKERDILKPQ